MGRTINAVMTVPDIGRETEVGRHEAGFSRIEWSIAAPAVSASTRVSRQVGEDLLIDSTDGVWFVAGTAYQSEHIPTTVAAAMALPFRPR